MKTQLVIVYLLFLTLSFSLKPKTEAQNHLRGKIGLGQIHDLKKGPEHKVGSEAQDHQQKLLDHEWNTPSSTSDFRHQEQQAHAKTGTENERDHELFTPSTSSSYHEHNKEKRENQHKWGSSNSHRHEWGQTTKSSYHHEWNSPSTHQNMHQEQEIKPRQHKMVYGQKVEMASDTDSPTSSSDYANVHNQSDDKQTKQDQKVNMQSHKLGDKKLHKLHKNQHRATNSYTSSSDLNHKAQGHDDNNIVRKRHHEVELHDEYSQADYDDLGDDDDYDQNGFRQKSGHGSLQARYPRQMHRQNDRDEPNNGQRYYYVDENGIRTEKDISSETSSVKQPDLRDYIDYNKPLDPDHPAVKSQTNRVTTDVPDTVGAAKGADFDDDTSVSSASTVSESVKELYDKKMSQGTTTGTTYETAGTTTMTTSAIPETKTAYTATTTPYVATTTTAYTTYVPQNTKIATGTAYHEQTMTTTTTSVDGNQQQSTMESGNQNHQSQKYQADANRNSNHAIKHQASAQTPQKQQHVQYGSGYTDDNDDDDMKDQNNKGQTQVSNLGSDDDNNNGDYHKN